MTLPYGEVVRPDLCASPHRDEHRRAVGPEVGGIGIAAQVDVVVGESFVQVDAVALGDPREGNVGVYCSGLTMMLRASSRRPAATSAS